MFQIGDEKFRLKSGDSLLAPRQIPHAFVHLRDEPGKIVTICQPAGQIEDFFHQSSKLVNPTPEQSQQLYKSHGMELLGPPLDVAAMLKFFES